MEPVRIVTNAPAVWEPGRYCVVRTHGWVPRIISAATHSPFDHAFVIVGSNGDIIEAEPGGVRRSNIREYAGCQMAINSAEVMTQTQRSTIVAAAEAMLHVPYNDLQIADDALIALHWHWRWLAKLAAGNHEVVCSQLVAQIGVKAGMAWDCGHADLAEVTPGDLGRRPVMRPVAVSASAF